MNNLKIKVWPNGTIEFFDEHGRLHNEADMPACVALDGSRAWFKHGKCHRDEGPAFMDADGTVHYWLNGEFIDQDDSQRKIPS